MLLETQNQASTYPWAPSRAYLNKIAQNEARPSYFVEEDGHIKIDITHPEWLALIESRKAKAAKKKPAKKRKAKASPKTKTKPEPPENPQGESFTEQEDFLNTALESKKAKMAQEVEKYRKLKLENEQLEIALRRSAGELIEYAAAEFLFTGYLEKMNIQLLSAPKKLEPVIDNLVKDGNTKGILKRLIREFENMIKEVKRAQKDDIEKWAEENK